MDMVAGGGQRPSDHGSSNALIRPAEPPEVSGWIAVLSLVPDGPAGLDEALGLAATYERLRGPVARDVAVATGLGHVVKLDREDAAAPGIERSPDGWAAGSGRPLGVGSLAEARPETLDGQWTLVRYDEASGELHAAVDAFGMLGLFACARDDRLYLSTSSLALATHLRTPPDADEVAAFLRLGYQFGPRTLWTGVRRFLPGEQLRLRAGQVSNDVHWRPGVDRHITAMDMSAAAQRLADVIVSSCARLQGDEEPYADLTGGFDSRTLTVSLARAGIRFQTTTNGEPGDRDVEIAREIARLRAWHWTRIGPPEDWPARFTALVPRALAWGDAQLDVLQLSETLCGHDLKREHHPTRTLFAGGGIEHFRHYAWYSEFLRAGRSRQVDVDRWISLLGMRPMDTSIFAVDPSAEVRRSMRDRFLTHLEPYAGELNTVQADMLYAYKSTGHFGAYAAAAGGHFDVLLPGYFKDVFTTAFSTSYRHRNAHRLNREVLERLDPEVASIRTAVGGPATPMRPANALRFAPYFATFARKGANKFGGLAGLSILAPSPTNRGFSAGRPASRRIAADMLTAGDGWGGELRAARLLNRAAVDDLLRRVRADDPSADVPLGRLLTVELALRTADVSV